MKKNKVLEMAFSKVYPLYVSKAEKKGRKKEEVDEIIFWLFGYTSDSLNSQLEKNVSVEDFVIQAPHLNENVSLITGVVCGIRVEEVEHEEMRKVRYLDKLIDELTRGKSLEKILRQ